MTQECSLSSALTLKDTQYGVAGGTGTVWIIAPDFTFTIARHIGPKILDPLKQGRLTPEQQVRFKAVLNRVGQAKLPKRLGSGPRVNARIITLSFGGADSVLTLPPGGGDLRSLRAPAGDDLAAAVLEIADTVKEITAG
jgi:hypothetical protein